MLSIGGKCMIIEIISWLATASSLAGQFLINKKFKSAFIIWIISNVLWIIVNIIGNFNTANVIMYIVYTVFNIVGYTNWKKSEKNKIE